MSDIEKYLRPSWETIVPAFVVTLSAGMLIMGVWGLIKNSRKSEKDDK